MLSTVRMQRRAWKVEKRHCERNGVRGKQLSSTGERLLYVQGQRQISSLTQSRGCWEG